jgi:parallel beta-helix repeat protein
MSKNNTITKISLALALSLSQLGMISLPDMVFAEPRVNQEIEQTLGRYSQIIHVDSRQGNDLTGKGNSAEPFKTITQALMIAQPKTIIKVAPGTYNAESGEHFPLTLKQDVIIQGDLSSKGRNTIIEGSGFFVSPTGAGQNATIVVTNQGAGVMGITVTNPTNRGHGIWIESSKPLISQNTITRNGNTGISVNGKATPTITHNNFFNNDGNGLLVYGTSTPIVENNDFERTGFGVSGVQSATIVLSNNTFRYNRIGVMLEGNSQAILRQNQITDSTEVGLMTIAQARADLGTNQNPGQNIFRGNAQSDIKNSSANQVITAFGNQLSGKTVGNVDLNANTSNVQIAQNNLTTPSSSSQTPLGGRMIEITASTTIRGNGSLSNPPSQTPLGGRMIEITAPTSGGSNLSQSNPSSQTPLGGRMIEITAPTSANNPLPVGDNYNYGHSSSTLNNNPLTGNNNSYSLSNLNIPPLPTKIPATETIIISGNLTPRNSIASGNGVTSSTQLPPPPPLSEPYRQSETNPDTVSNSNDLFSMSSNENKSVMESENLYNQSQNEELQQSSPPPLTESPRPLPYSRETNPPSTIEPSVTTIPPTSNSSNSNPVRRTLGDILLTTNGGNSNVSSNPTNQPSSNNTPVNNNQISRALQYKIVVETKNSTQESQVRSLYPDSFRTNYNGNTVLQVGVFSSQEKAQQVIQSLKSVGLNPLVIQ